MKTLTILLLCLLLPCTAFASIGNDKIGHFVVGFGISAAIGGERGLWTGIGAGAGKEVYDSFHPKNHSVEFWDFACTALGSYTAFKLIKVKPKKQPTMTIELYDGTKI